MLYYGLSRHFCGSEMNVDRAEMEFDWMCAYCEALKWSLTGCVHIVRL